MSKQESIEISYAQEILMKILKEKKLRAFTTQHNLEYISFFKTVQGHTYPSNIVVWKLRKVIHPILWFYNTNEKLPILKEYAPDGLQEFNYIESIACEEMCKIDGIAKWAEDRSLSYSSVFNTYKKEAAPSFAKIKAWRDYFYPADWYFSKKTDELIPIIEKTSSKKEKNRTIFMSNEEFAIIDNARKIYNTNNNKDITFNRFFVETVLESIKNNPIIEQPTIKFSPGWWVFKDKFKLGSVNVRINKYILYDKMQNPIRGGNSDYEMIDSDFKNGVKTGYFNFENMKKIALETDFERLQKITDDTQFPEWK